MTQRLLTTREVAEALGVPLATFQRKVVRLREHEGFPSPLIGRRYDPIAIDRWRRDRAGLLAAPAAPEPAPPAEPDLEAWQAQLDARSQQIGRDGALP
jgi:DNA-directed RNA polymerase specialized sigma24 family protein